MLLLLDHIYLPTVYARVCAGMCQSIHAEVRGQPTGVGSILPPSVSWGSNASFETERVPLALWGYFKDNEPPGRVPVLVV